MKVRKVLILPSAQNLIRPFHFKMEDSDVIKLGREVRCYDSTFLFNKTLISYLYTTYVIKLLGGRRKLPKPPDKVAVPMHEQGLISSASHWFTNISPI